MKEFVKSNIALFKMELTELQEELEKVEDLFLDEIKSGNLEAKLQSTLKDFPSLDLQQFEKVNYFKTIHNI